MRAWQGVIDSCRYGSKCPSPKLNLGLSFSSDCLQIGSASFVFIDSIRGLRIIGARAWRSTRASSSSSFYPSSPSPSPLVPSCPPPVPPPPNSIIVMRLLASRNMSSIASASAPTARHLSDETKETLKVRSSPVRPLKTKIHNKNI